FVLPLFHLALKALDVLAVKLHLAASLFRRVLCLLLDFALLREHFPSRLGGGWPGLLLHFPPVGTDLATRLFGSLGRLLAKLPVVFPQLLLRIHGLAVGTLDLRPQVVHL